MTLMYFTLAISSSSCLLLHAYGSICFLSSILVFDRRPEENPGHE
ncbi:hypothetical protein AVEN_197404-1, partial [Araneus ventricosus]